MRLSVPFGYSLGTFSGAKPDLRSELSRDILKLFYFRKWMKDMTEAYGPPEITFHKQKEVGRLINYRRNDPRKADFLSQFSKTAKTQKDYAPYKYVDTRGRDSTHFHRDDGELYCDLVVFDWID